MLGSRAVLSFDLTTFMLKDLELCCAVLTTIIISGGANWNTVGNR